VHVRFGRRASETDGSNATRRWCSTLPYIPLSKGFIYLVAIMDWHSRAVLAWRISNTLHADFCVDALEEALRRFGKPEIFNTDQGSQFTSTDFTGVLKAHAIKISLDGKGRCMDNIFVERLWRSLKYEDIYLHAYASVAQALGRHWGVAALLQRGMPSSGTRLPDAPADLPRAMPVDRGTAGRAERCRFPWSSSQIGKRRNAHRRPQAHRHIYQEGFGD
jgi:transposase InsO family protein